MLVGGIRNGIQRFDRQRVSVDATLAILAAIAISVPSIFNHAIEPDFQRVEWLSLTPAAVVLVLYGLYILYSFQQPVKNHGDADAAAHATPHWSISRSLIIMIVAVAGLAIMSEYLVGTLDAVTAQFGLTEFFVGIIVVPIIGNVAEHLVAVQVAVKNQMDLSLSIALGSSLQIALLVAPLLVFISLRSGNPMALEFNNFELIAMLSGSLVAAFVALDGRSNWLEGAMLLAVYGMLALAFYFLPATI